MAIAATVSISDITLKNL